MLNRDDSPPLAWSYIGRRDHYSTLSEAVDSYLAFSEGEPRSLEVIAGSIRHYGESVSPREVEATLLEMTARNEARKMPEGYVHHRPYARKVLNGLVDLWGDFLYTLILLRRD